MVKRNSNNNTFVFTAGLAKIEPDMTIKFRDGMKVIPGWQITILGGTEKVLELKDYWAQIDYAELAQGWARENERLLFHRVFRELGYNDAEFRRKPTE